MSTTQTARNPIASFEAEIVGTLADKDVLVLRGPTGSGKSTEIGPMLHRAGYKVVITQPRKLPAWSIATFVAKLLSVILGKLVGWKTGDGGKMSPETMIKYLTDGLLLKWLVNGHLEDSPKVVYVIDEVHERSTIIDTLLALLRREKLQGAKFKVVLMSATIEPGILATYYGGSEKVGIVDVPGRLFPITEEDAGSSIEADAVELACAGRNVLVFVASVPEVHSMVARLRKMAPDAIVLPLFADLETAEQEKVFTADRHGKPVIIVSTPVAQTSLTIPYIDAVVDSGFEYREEMDDGVRGLGKRPISRACMKQRAGRAGRCKPGVVRHHNKDWDRLEYPVPEIRRVSLSETMLDLLQDGIDIRELCFLDQPPADEVKSAEATLRALGFIEGTDRLQITASGREAVRYPVECHIDRMLIEARHRGCLADMVAIAALFQVGGIRDSRTDDAKAWERLVGSERESDLLAHLAAYRKAKEMSRDERLRNGVHSKACDDVKRVEKKLRAVLGSDLRDGEENAASRDTLLKCIAAGMVDHLYHRNYGVWYKDVDRTTGDRKLDRDSVLFGDKPEWIVGIPFTIGRAQIIQMATKVDPVWMVEVAPHLCERKAEGVYFRGYRIS